MRSGGHVAGGGSDRSAFDGSKRDGSGLTRLRLGGQALSHRAQKQCAAGRREEAAVELTARHHLGAEGAVEEGIRRLRCTPEGGKRLRIGQAVDSVNRAAQHVGWPRVVDRL